MKGFTGSKGLLKIVDDATKELAMEHLRPRIEELAAQGMEPTYIARQIVDDYFRATGQSLHLKQHLVEQGVRKVLNKEEV